jgi:hypothetical protein
MKYMQVHVRDATFFVFSDDMAWCRQAFHVVDRISFVEGCTGEDEELQLMTHCRHHIISNSSFSWWGAWLGTYADKIVLTPSRWSPDATLNEQFMERDGIIPQDWIQIEV